MDDFTRQVRVLKILHMALVAGCAGYLVISVMVNRLSGPLNEFKENTPVFMIVCTMISAVSVFSGIFLFKKRLTGIQNRPLSERIILYRTAMMIRAAMIEGAAFLCTTFFLLSGDMLFLLEAIACIIILIMLVPSEYKVASDIQHEIG